MYSTCSLEPEECERVVERVGGVRRVSVDGLTAELGEQGIFFRGLDLDSAVREGALRTLPGVHAVGMGFMRWCWSGSEGFVGWLHTPGTRRAMPVHASRRFTASLCCPAAK